MSEMRRFGVLILLMIAMSAQAAPFLVCDPYPVAGVLPDMFSVQLDATAIVVVPATTNPDGTRYLHYDLANVPISGGSHVFTVIAQSTNPLVGASAPANFTFQKATLSAPGGLQIKAN